MSAEFDPEALRARLEERWGDRSPTAKANAAAGALYGTPGDWDLPADVTPQKPLLYLAVGIPDAASLPKSAFGDAASAVLGENDDRALRYGFGQGPSEIREWLSARRSAESSFAVDVDRFQLTNGSSGAIDLIVRSLIEPGDVIVSESPVYMGTLHNFRGVQATIDYVSVDEHGLVTDELEATLEARRREGRPVKIIHTISAFQNPTGVTMSLERRHALLELAERYDALVLDDEAYRDLWFDEPPPESLASLAGGHGVVTVGTFSKTIATGIRVGWIEAAPSLIGLFSRMRFAMGQNQLGLRMLQHFLLNDGFDRHVAAVRSIYRSKRDVLLGAMEHNGVDEFLDWRVPGGGFYVWAELKERLELDALHRMALHEGIAVNSGQGFMPAGVSRHIRIAYPWTPTAHIEDAIERLGAACRRVAAGERV